MIPRNPTSETAGSSPNSGTEPVVITESTDPTAKARSSKPPSTPSGRTKSDSFRPIVFLYRMLLGIFIVEAVFLGFSFRTCNQLALKFPEKTVNQHCPRLSEKAESLFGIAVATTLSLLTGQAVESFKNKG